MNARTLGPGRWRISSRRWWLLLALGAGCLGDVTPRLSAARQISATIGDFTPLNSNQLPEDFPLRLSVGAPVAGASYQWFRNGAALAGETTTAFFRAHATPADTGNYFVRETLNGVASESEWLPVTVQPRGPSLVDRTFRAQLPDDGEKYAPFAPVGDGGLMLSNSVDSTPAAVKVVRLRSDGSFVSQFTLPAAAGRLLGGVEDGSILTSAAPYRILADGSPAPFTLPSDFEPAALISAMGLHDGGWLISQSSRIARYRSDGTLDPAFREVDLGANHYFHGMMEDPRGGFLTFDQHPYLDTVVKVDRLVRFHADGSFDEQFNIQGVAPLQTMSAEISAEGILLTQRLGLMRGYRGLELSSPEDVSTYFGQPEQIGLGSFAYLDAGGGLIGTLHNTGNLARWLPRDGMRLDPHFNGGAALRADGTRSSLWSSRRFLRGDAYITGDFTTWDGYVSPRLVRLLPTDPTLRTLHVSRALESSTEGLRVTATGTGALRYQWHALDGQDLPANQTSATLALGATTPSKYDRYQVAVTDDRGTVLSEILSVPDEHLILAGLSGRGRTGTGENQLTAGILIRQAIGGSTQNLLFRGAGPALRDYGVAGTLADPVLQLFDGRSAALQEVNDWEPTTELVTQTAAAGLPSYASGSADAAFVRRALTLGAYTVQLRDRTGGSGIGLVETYDLGNERTDTPAAAWGELAGISLRAQVGAGDAVAIGGFIIREPPGASASAGKTMRVLIRVTGPALARYGIAQPLRRPFLKLFGADGLPVSTTLLLGDLSSPGSSTVRDAERDLELPWDGASAAVVYDLPAGAYTAQVSSIGGGTGVALLEIYRVR